MSLFEQLGGSHGVRALVDELSRRLAADPVLGPIFIDVDGPTLQQHREHYLAAILGGPENYTGRGLRDAHRSLELNNNHVDRFLHALETSLAAVGAAPGATTAVVEVLEGVWRVMVRLGGEE